MKADELGRRGFERCGRTRCAAFLVEMNKIVPWAQLYALFESNYTRPERGRPPVPLRRLLRGQ